MKKKINGKDIKSESVFFSFFKKNVVYSISLIFERSVSFLLLPLYTHILLPSEYGIYTMILSFISVAVFLYSLGLENGLLKYSAEAEDKSLLNSTIFWGMIVLASVLTCFILLFSESISIVILKDKGYKPFIEMSAGILFFETIIRFFLCAVIGEQKSKIYFLIGLFKGVIIIFLNIYLLLILKMGLQGVILSYLLSSGVATLTVLMFSLRRLKFRFDQAIFKKVFFFGYPMMLTSVFLTLLNYFDRYLIQFFFTASEVGEYSAAYKIGLIMNIVVSAFSMGALPFVSHLLKENKNQTAVFPKLLSILFFVTISIFTFSSLFINEIVRIKLFGYAIINEKYLGAIGLVPIILLSYLFYGIYINFTLIIYYREKTKALSIVTFFAFLINLGFNWILIPRYSVIGAAVATLVSFLFMTIAMFFYSRKLLVVQYDWVHIFRIFSLSILIYLISLFFFKSIFAVKMCLYLVFQVVVCYHIIKFKLFQIGLS